jgi:hypothetical protein
VVVPTTVGGNVNLYLSTLRNAVQLHGVQIAGSFSAWSAESRAYVRLEPFLNLPCRIEGDIDLHSIRLRQFELKGARVRGRIRLDGCDMLRFSARPGLLCLPTRREAAFDKAAPSSEWSTEDALVLSEVGHLLMRNGRISGDLRLEYLQLTGREIDGLSGLVIEDSAIDGNLLMFGEDAILSAFKRAEESTAQCRSRCPIDYCNFSASVVGGIRLKRSQVGATVDMSAAKVDGVIDFEDSKFGGDVRLSAVRRSDDGDASGLEAYSRLWNPATCEAVGLRMAKCTNDVDMTGLIVVRHPARPGETGLINGRYASVDGDLICFDENRFGLPAFTRVESHLDLSYSRLAHLVVSGCMFDADDAPAHKRGLLLERATVGKLDVREAHGFYGAADSADELRGSHAYPVPICLTDVKVEVWEVEGTPDRDNHEERKYINLLANDQPFRRSTYRSLENSLRNSGDNEHADLLYRAMRRREWEEARRHAEAQLAAGDATLLARCRHQMARWSGFTAHHAFRVFLQYGTSPKSLFAVVFLLFAISLPAYRVADNFEASLSFLAVPSDHFVSGQDAPRYNRGPSPSDWGWPDALQVALKNHVPMVPLQVRDDWQPRDQGRTSWSLDHGSCLPSVKTSALTACLPWAPEDVFNALQLINWICWPLLLTFYIRRLLRQS